MRILLILSCLIFIANASFAVDAFPTAEGYGASTTTGGRGGVIYIVDTLSDNPADGVTFREAVTASGARTVVFAVSGTIMLTSLLKIANPYLTIAGQTSPGGIEIAGWTTTFKTHDVIMRHMRFRLGTAQINYETDGNGDRVYYTESQPQDYTTCSGTTSNYANGYPCDLLTGAIADDLDCVNILGEFWEDNEVYDIIFDHCSFQWGVDETLTLTGGVANTTIQWSIVSEGLNRAGHSTADGEGHSKGLMFSGKYRYDQSISLHHNYIASNHDRSPLLHCPDDAYNNTCTYDGRNNISYNWYHGLMPMVETAPSVNWVSNYAKEGPDSYSGREVTVTEKAGATEREMLYVYNNVGATKTPRGANEWNVGTAYYSTLISDVWQKDIAWTTPAVTTTTMDADYAAEILTTVGATVPSRDAVDTAIVSDFTNNTGSMVLNVTYPDDYPTYSTSGDNPTDTDSDGMPDIWETANGTSTTVANNNSHTFDADYTDIEYYINALAGDYENSGSGSGSPLGGNSHFNNIGTGLSTAHLRTE